MDREFQTTNILIVRQAQREQLGCRWEAIDERRAQLMQGEAVAESQLADDAIAVYAAAALQALQWAIAHTRRDVTVHVDNHEFVRYLTNEGEPPPYQATLVAPLLPLLRQLEAAVVCGVIEDRHQITNPTDHELAAPERTRRAELHRASQVVSAWLMQWPAVREELHDMAARSTPQADPEVSELADLDARLQSLLQRVRAVGDQVTA